MASGAGCDNLLTQKRRSDTGRRKMQASCGAGGDSRLGNGRLAARALTGTGSAQLDSGILSSTRVARSGLVR
jgi:hypothetical protein